MGRKQLKDDYAQAEKIFGVPTSYIKDLQYDPETIMFMFEAKGHSISFTLGIDDAYPEGSMLFPPDGDPQIYDVPLPRVLEDVAKVYCKKFSIPYEAPAASTAAPPAQAATEAAATKVRKLAASFEEHEDEDDEEEEGYEDPLERSPRLEEDIKSCRAHGYNVTFREYQALDMLDVELHILSAFIDHRIGSAWGVASGKPIVVRLTVSPSIYDNSSTVPKVEVLQSGARCGLSTQLGQIVSSFCIQHWKHFGQCTTRHNHTAAPTRTASIVKNEPAKKTHESNKKKKTALPKGIAERDVTKLVDMGFEEDMAVRALKASNGNVEDASHLLLEDQSSLWEQEKEKEKEKSIRGDVYDKDFIAQEKSDKEQKQYTPDYSDGFLLQILVTGRKRPEYAYLSPSPHLLRAESDRLPNSRLEATVQNH